VGMRGWWGLRGGYERGGGEIVGARGMGWGMAGEKGGGEVERVGERC